MNWQDFEESVRQIASSHWNAPAKAEEIAGIRCDAVIRVSSDEIVVIEITKEDNLAKLRLDLAKFASIRTALVPEGVVVRSFFISARKVSSLRETGKAQKVEVLSVKEFREKFVGKESYEFARKSVEFGSALDPYTNKSDTGAFIETGYLDKSSGTTYNVDEISDLLSNGRRIILLGEFGTGKSRCAREVFERVSRRNILFPTLAINLREHWGHQSFDLIVRSHLSSLGLSGLEDSAVRLVRSGALAFILDGIDEIGSQSWSGEPERLREIRRRSLQGVRDIVSKLDGKGVLLCGRAHYFSDDEEMLSCLGLDIDTILLNCPDEFTEDQAIDYLRLNTGLTEFPEWSPRKPLICQLFSKLEPETMRKLIEDSTGEVQFFENTFQAICERETRIHPSIDAEVLRKVLLEIAKASRRKNEFNEEISPLEINEAFHQVSGFMPLDEASSILQRLPYLGRVSSGSGNRRFVDDYAKSGLRGVALVEAFRTSDKAVAEDLYRKPVGPFGAKFLFAHALIGSEAEKYCRLCNSRGNMQIAADYLCSAIEAASGSIDFSQVTIRNASIDRLELSDLKISGLHVSGTFFEVLHLDGAFFIDSNFSNCAFQQIIGVSDKVRLPSAFSDDCDFDGFSSADNVARISELPLSNGHKTLVAIIRKLFFQPGSGRKEEALLRGASSYWDRAAATEAVRYMLTNDIITEAPGDHGKLYIPNRKFTRRMGRIRSLLRNCDDELWNVVSRV
ncbi:hypothetical protein FDP22_06855 [Paroceanicella profunda]|uniref:NACHT domain-containing protein n=1 Tax=Paroceanicella profunda TaxID=2579971 RepID=A0A5B8FRZ4_9RHOB|nr:hypothetical protein [Paroceanicella profunda]QDL91526.1 hypothetical protein FDP22_06855 [Paroceanicella profunda]